MQIPCQYANYADNGFNRTVIILFRKKRIMHNQIFRIKFLIILLAAIITPVLLWTQDTEAAQHKRVIFETDMSFGVPDNNHRLKIDGEIL